LKGAGRASRAQAKKAFRLKLEGWAIALDPSSDPSLLTREGLECLRRRAAKALSEIRKASKTQSRGGLGSSARG
jgi:glutamine cyclotransferase